MHILTKNRDVVKSHPADTRGNGMSDYYPYGLIAETFTLMTEFIVSLRYLLSFPSCSILHFDGFFYFRLVLSCTPHSIVAGAIYVSYSIY